MTSSTTVQDASPQLGAIGSAFYFTPETLAAGKTLGLDGFRFYMLGRGGVLGDVEAPVIASAFGYFKPEVVAAMWDSGRQIISPRDAGRAYVECSREFGRARFTSLDGLGAFCEAAEAVVTAADPAGLALYAGLAAEPLATDLPARAQQLVTVLREWRGSAHLLALVATGVSPRTAHYLRRPNDFALFGWGDDDVPAVTADDHAQLASADSLTDRLLTPAYSVLDEAGATAIRQTLTAMGKALPS